ncbi:ABC transporter substrate-binding protein [Protaetiibacter larvae]|uniref:Spermidine/putrescine ABC transporter substrate-binding protein n=1 Tax=Protaetiibacter larvae TaxID=2592654 RepID=A0A5C1YBV9_9MICO|nr:spermidine/putrescine ABC transporter substrate-binding protein [Protaetiibacter larvae]QEO10347.1 spermidine/putrescine ABC transporter substrate-binding protein [Protaetiibacter larvae]
MSRSLPEDPLIRSLVVQARRAQLSRRTMLQGAGIGAAALTLAACAPSGGGKPSPAEDTSETDKTLTWANWPLYLDTDDDGNHPTLDQFTKETGIAVDYREDVEDNEQFYSKVKDQLALGQDIGADTVCLTDWMVDRWIRLGYTQTLDDANIPNKKNLEPSLLNVDFDEGRTQSLPWQGGFAGICWNKEEVPNGLRSVSDLWDPALKGRVGVLSEMRDTLGLIMLEQGVDISADFTDAQFGAAISIFEQKVKSGQIRNIKGNSYAEDLANGDTIAAIVWSGDVTTLNAENGDKWEFAIPDGGGTIWNDNFLVPVGSPRKTNAEKLIDFYYDPEIAAQVAAWVNYITPVVGAREAAEAIDPSLVDNQLIFPNEETLSKVKRFRSLTPAEDQAYRSEFQRVLLGA